MKCMEQVFKTFIIMTIDGDDPIVFEKSAVPFTFTKNRKTFRQIASRFLFLELKI